MEYLITVIDDVTETSMPFNEFVIYRANHYTQEKEIVVVCTKRKRLPNIKIPDNVELRFVGNNPFYIRKTLNGLIRKLNKENKQFVIHIHSNKAGSLVQLSMIGTDFRKKTVFTVHSTFSGYALHNKIRSLINTTFASEVVCVSDVSFNDYPQFIKSKKAAHFHMIRNGFDEERINSIISQIKKNEQDKVVFIYVARLVPFKNHEFLIDVIKEAPDNCKFIFVGKKDANGSIQHKINKMGLQNIIELTDLIPRDEVFKKLVNADVYISSSRLEGLPVSVLEGMYCGLPVILSAIPQHQEVVMTCDFSKILPFEKNKWLAAIKFYSELSKNEIEERGTQAKEYVSKKFSLRIMHILYEDVYKKLQ